MFTLRDYQEEAKTGVKKSFTGGNKRVVLCMPTGAGKTVTFVSMVHDVISRGKRAMIICDRKELIGQAYDKVKMLGIIPTVIAPGYKMTTNSVYLASVDTLRRRDIPQVDLIIIDEAHKQSFDGTIQRYLDAYNPFMIGATATPLRTGPQKPMDLYYQDIVEPVTTQDLLDRNFLVPARTFSSKQDFSDVKKRGSDFDIGAMYEKFNKSKLYDGVVDNYLKFSEGKKAICFNVNVEHSVNMVQKFRDAGIPAVHLDGKTSNSERRKILQDFKHKNFILSNCSVLTTGFDEPTIETVIVNRATMSLPLWLQMTGRGSRISEGKDNFTIIDQGSNVWSHGLWEEERTWSLQKKKKRKGDGVAPVKVCDKCGELNSASAKKCKECDHVFPVEEKKLAKGEFVEVNKKRWIGKIPDPKTCTRQELHDYAKFKGYKPGWVFKQLQLAKRM